MNATEKYLENRSKIYTGDVILFRGKSLLAKTVRHFDDAYYNHIGVVFIVGGRRFILDSCGKGARPDFLSLRMAENEDFCIIRPRNLSYNQIKTGIGGILNGAEAGIPYDRALLVRIAIYRKLGLDITKLGDKNKDICSEFARRYTDLVGVDCYKPERTGIDWITPQDFIRYAKPNEISIIFNNSIIQDNADRTYTCDTDRNNRPGWSG